MLLHQGNQDLLPLKELVVCQHNLLHGAPRTIPVLLESQMLINPTDLQSKSLSNLLLEIAQFSLSKVQLEVLVALPNSQQALQRLLANQSSKSMEESTRVRLRTGNLMVSEILLGSLTSESVTTSSTPENTKMAKCTDRALSKTREPVSNTLEPLPTAKSLDLASILSSMGRSTREDFSMASSKETEPLLCWFCLT